MNTSKTARKTLRPWMGDMDTERAAPGWVVHATGLASDDVDLAQVVEDMGWVPHDQVIKPKSMLIHLPLDMVAANL